jgi:hypothetical protein
MAKVNAGRKYAMLYRCTTLSCQNLQDAVSLKHNASGICCRRHLEYDASGASANTFDKYALGTAATKRM